MTEQDSYIAGQKASGIEVGDTVRVARPNKIHEGGSDACHHTQRELDEHRGNNEFAVIKIRPGAITIQNKEQKEDGVWWVIPYFVLEIVKKANGSKPINTITGESNMKTQEIYSYVVTENINVKDAKTGQIEKVSKKLIDHGVVAAYGEANAKIQAMVQAGVPDNNCDIDEVEVLVRPFCSE